MTVQNITLHAADGYPLTATHFQAPGERFIVMAGATGVPRGFYRRFAEYAQAHGYNVVTTDYRGIGDSMPLLANGVRAKTLKGFVMEYADWSNKDLAAAVDFCTSRGLTHLVGHSLGGHAIGQLPNPNRLQSAYVCAAGAGWHGWMPKAEQIRVQLLWKVIGPVATSILGYMPMKRFGMGENLPMGVYRDWRHWCSFPHYFFDDPAAGEVTMGFKDVRIPIISATATDDLWAQPKSRDAFMKGYVNAKLSAVDFTPSQLGVSEIGHMGYFRESVGRVLWPKILAAVQSYTSPA